MQPNVDKELVQSIRYFAFDSDGCIFSNMVWEGVPFKPKARSYYDGQGVSLMRALGIRTCVITNEKDANAAAVRSVVAKWNSLPSCKNGDWPEVELFEGCGGHRKLETLNAWLKCYDGKLSECGAMGDDLVDVPMLKTVAFAAAPISAELAVRNLCSFVSERPGGEGAVRDLANFFVEVHGKNPLELPFD